MSEHSTTSDMIHWKKNFYLFLTGQFLSGITSMTVQYSIIWYLTKTTGSATVLSFALLLGMLPMVLLSPFAGPLIDRWNDFSRFSFMVSVRLIIGSFCCTNFSKYQQWYLKMS